jgi:hypothetical protein
VGVAKFLSYPLQVLKGTDDLKKLQLLQLWRIFTAVGDRKTAVATYDREKFLNAVLAPAFYPDLDQSRYPEKTPEGRIGFKQVRESLLIVRQPKVGYVRMVPVLGTSRTCPTLLYLHSSPFRC